MIVNENSIVQLVIQIKNGIMKYVNVSVKIIAHAKKIISANLVQQFVNVTNHVPTNVANTISANATSTVPLNSDNKKVRYAINCYVLYTFLLVTILLFIITIICFVTQSIDQKQKNIITLAI